MKTNTKKTSDRSALLFGKSAADPLACDIISNIATWPKRTAELTDRRGSFAQVVKWKARRGEKKRETIIEARNHPAVDWLLEIIIPALCARDSKPFRLIADAVETHKNNAFPANQIALTTCQLAVELAGLAMPYNAVGERLVNNDGQQEDIQLPNIIRVPVTESELLRQVNKRLGWSEQDGENPGSFTRILKRLGIQCRKKSNSGGRGRKVLPQRPRKQKPAS